MNSFSSFCRTSYDFEDIKYLAEGSEGIVFIAKSRLDQQFYAIKRIILPEVSNLQKQILNEVRQSAELAPNHVVRYYFAWTETDCPPSEFSHQRHTDSKTYLYIQTEYCPNGTLSHLIDEGLHTELKRRHRWAVQVTQAMCHVHKKNITHGDLHSGNVFVDNDYDMKIGDFGLSLKHQKTKSAGSPQQEFQTRSIEDIKNLIKLVIELLVPLARNPENGSGTYGQDKRNFINQKIEEPGFDQDVKNHILILRALINAQDDLLTAQEVLDVLNKNFIDDNNNMSAPMDVEEPKEAPSNNKTLPKQQFSTPVDGDGLKKTKGVREASESSAKPEGNWFSWITDCLSTYSTVLYSFLAFVIVILIGLVVWMVKESRKKDTLIRKLGSTYGPKLKSIAVSAMI